MPFVIVSADPTCFHEKNNNNIWTRVTYGSSNIHEQIPGLRDVGEYTHDKETMSWTFKTLPCKLLDRFERIGYHVVASTMTNDLITWTLQLKIAQCLGIVLKENARLRLFTQLVWILKKGI